jgi:hypothetical protein
MRSQEYQQVNSQEYHEVLESVIEALLLATKDERLPDLAPEQIHFWLTHLDLSEVWDAWANVRTRSVRDAA